MRIETQENYQTAEVLLNNKKLILARLIKQYLAHNVPYILFI